MTLDPSAFGPPEPQEAPTLPLSVQQAPKDADGFPIPKFWQHSPNWNKQARVIRQKWSKVWVDDEIEKERQAKLFKPKEDKPKATRLPATRFTTEYGCRWGKRQLRLDCDRCWKLIEREHYNSRTKRHADLELGMDAFFDDGGPGRFGCQFGQPDEEKAHARAFLERGGYELAARRGIRPYWVAFVRGRTEPALDSAGKPIVVLWTEKYLRDKWPDLFEKKVVVPMELI